MNPTGDPLTKTADANPPLFPKRANKKGAKLVLGWCFLIAMFFAVATGAMALYKNGPWINGINYRALELGSSIDEVIDLFDRPTDERFSVGAFQVLMYYAKGDPAAGPRKGKSRPANQLESYDDFSEVTHSYATIECLFNDTDKLVAYSWAGEEYHVHTLLGDFAGSTLSGIPADVLKELETL